MRNRKSCKLLGWFFQFVMENWDDNDFDLAFAPQANFFGSGA